MFELLSSHSQTNSVIIYLLVIIQWFEWFNPSKTIYVSQRKNFDKTSLNYNCICL